MAGRIPGRDPHHFGFAQCKPQPLYLLGRGVTVKADGIEYVPPIVFLGQPSARLS